MIKISIEDSTEEFETADDIKPQWIREQIQNRPKDNSYVCVRVVIDENGKSFRLQTSAVATDLAVVGHLIQMRKKSLIFGMKKI